MANFTSITGKKKDYSIAELLDERTTQKSSGTVQKSSGTTGTFDVPSVTEIAKGIDESVSGIAEYLPGVTSVGSAIKGYYRNKSYQEDEAAAQAKLEAVENSKPTYSESENLKASRDELAEIESGRPSEYQSKYDDEISQLINELGETKKFNYDVESDPLWHSIKDQYQRNAILGMQNAMGDAANLTGGYGSSNAVIAGQQAYQQNISEMTDIIPELQNTALNAWQANRGALTDNLYALMNADDADYNKWLNEYNMWATDREYYAQKVANMSDEEFNRYLAELSSWESDRAYYAGQKQQAVANQQWEANFAEQRRQFNQQMAFNYINMGVGAAVDLTTAGMSAGVSLAGIGVDAALGGAELAIQNKQYESSLAEEQRQFDASLAQDSAMSEKEYELALKELAEEQRQFNIKNGVGTGTVSTQSVPITGEGDGGNPIVDGDGGNPVENQYSEDAYKRFRIHLANMSNNSERISSIQENYMNGYINDEQMDSLMKKYNKQ